MPTASVPRIETFLRMARMLPWLRKLLSVAENTRNRTAEIAPTTSSWDILMPKRAVSDLPEPAKSDPPSLPV
ncbi:hypothetical protein [Mesorhizobium sp. M7A.F.Ca.CA.001.10.2.1]|uniref:hypothetical protein n=2 Tax=unclassified Mesorhizobium TaxID=325217 RepID=UPI0019D2ADBA|nr:hypothetical protein [Mesorhizobium sp. M7A.F.Ca.CA.001.10.2.1]